MMNKKLIILFVLVLGLFLIGCEETTNSDLPEEIVPIDPVEPPEPAPSPINPEEPPETEEPQPILPPQEPWEPDSCSDFDEQECLESEDCQGIYGPSFCDGDICTSDYVFLACREN